MAKLIVCIALFCVALAAVNGAPRGGGPQGGRGPQGGQDGRGPHHGHDGQGQWESKICANSSLTGPFLTQMRQALTELQNNGSFTTFLQRRQNEINYINDASNTDLISSNCTQFFTGLNNARTLDRTAAQQQMQLERSAEQKLRAVVQGLLGTSSVDSSEEGGF